MYAHRMETNFFDVVVGEVQRDTLAQYLFIICQDYVLRTSIDLIKENALTLEKSRSRRNLTDADYADNIALLINTPAQADSQLHSLEEITGTGKGLHVNGDKMENVCLNQPGDISTQNGGSLKCIDKFTFLGSSMS